MKSMRRVHRIHDMGYAFVSGGGSLSSLIATLFGECGADNGYTQTGQCKCCSKSHDAPNFTSNSPSNQKRMLELVESKGWKWRWTEGSGGNERLVLNKSGGSFSVVGAPKDAALIIGTVLVCASMKQLDGFRMSFPKLLAA